MVLMLSRKIKRLSSSNGVADSKNLLSIVNSKEEKSFKPFYRDLIDLS